MYIIFNLKKYLNNRQTLHKHKSFTEKKELSFAEHKLRNAVADSSTILTYVKRKIHELRHCLKTVTYHKIMYILNFQLLIFFT